MLTVYAALLMSAQSAVADWRPVDILVTSLLTIVTGLVTWILRTVLQHQDDVTRLKDRVGLTGDNGHHKKLEEHSRALRDLEEDLTGAWRRFDRLIMQVIRRLDRLEQHARLPRAGRDADDDTEDDRRG